jgi:hypothetical protein
MGQLDAATLHVDKGALEEDWRRDSQGRSDLDYHRFALAWFQIADQVSARPLQGQAG